MKDIYLLRSNNTLVQVMNAEGHSAQVSGLVLLPNQSVRCESDLGVWQRPTTTPEP
jgi:hypothetical protein